MRTSLEGCFYCFFESWGEGVGMNERVDPIGHQMIHAATKRTTSGNDIKIF